MKNKPSWRFWITWVIAYSILDIIGESLLHGHPAWNQLPAAIEGAFLGATLTWFFALFLWYKAQDRFELPPLPASPQPFSPPARHHHPPFTPSHKARYR